MTPKLRLTKAGQVAFAIGALGWLLAIVMMALAHPTRAQVGYYLILLAVIGPGGVIAAGAIGILMQELLLLHVVQPTTTQVTFVLVGLIPSVAKGFFWAWLVQVIERARTRARQ